MEEPLLIFQKIRESVVDFARSCSDEELHQIPLGFSNNIFWNLGHLVVTEQLLLYKRSSLPIHIPEVWLSSFRKGSAPSELLRSIPLEPLLETLAQQPKQLKDDFGVDIFNEYEPFITGMGVSIENIHQAIAFNVFHEGMHFGVMSSLRKHIY
jgi:hypothetical protein